MAKIGFLGLGIMGYPMARNLRSKGGHDLWVWSHTAEKAARLAAEEGAVACATPAEVAGNADYIFLCVGNTEMSREVIFGEDGVVHGARAGSVVVDTSTISAAESRKMADELGDSGVGYVDAPVTGSKLGAEAGKLTFMIGAEPDLFNHIRPLLEPMGQQLFHCGPQGMGIRVKISQNLIQANILQAFVEGILLSTKAGVDPELMLDVLNNTAAKSGLIAFKAPYVFERDFSTHFSTRWMNKDVGLALELAEDLQVPVPVTSVTKQIYQAAMAQGLENEDFVSVIKVLEKMAGVVVKKK